MMQIYISCQDEESTIYELLLPHFLLKGNILLFDIRNIYFFLVLKLQMGKLDAFKKLPSIESVYLKFFKKGSQMMLPSLN